MVEEKKEKLVCPCCGKELFDVIGVPSFVDNFITVLQQHPSDLGQLVVGMFKIMHNPESGEPFEG